MFWKTKLERPTHYFCINFVSAQPERLNKQMMSALLDSSMRDTLSWDEFHTQTRCRTSVACNVDDINNDSTTSISALSLQGGNSPKRHSHGESVPNLGVGSSHQKKRINRQHSLSSSSSHSRMGLRRYLEKQRSYSTNGTTMGKIDKSGKFVPARKLKN